MYFKVLCTRLAWTPPSQGFALCACDLMSLTIPPPRALYVAIDGYPFWDFGMVVASYRAAPTYGTRACEYDLWRTQLNFLLLCIFSLSPALSNTNPPLPLQAPSNGHNSPFPISISIMPHNQYNHDTCPRCRVQNWGGTSNLNERLW